MDRRIIAQLYDCIDQIRDLNVCPRLGEKSLPTAQTDSENHTIPFSPDGAVSSSSNESLFVEELSSIPQVVILIAATNRFVLALARL